MQQQEQHNFEGLEKPKAITYQKLNELWDTINEIRSEELSLSSCSEKEFLHYVEEQYTFYRLFLLIDLVSREQKLGKGISLEDLKALQRSDLLTNRWERVLNTNLVYTENLVSVANRSCVKFAQFLEQALKPQDKNANYFQLLMPTINGERVDTATGKVVDTLSSDDRPPLFGYILSDDCKTLIDVCDCLEGAQQDGKLKSTVLDINNQIVFLGENESSRLLRHLPQCAKYYQSILDFLDYEKKSQPGKALLDFIKGLKAGSANDGGTGTEMNADAVANEAIAKFAKYLEQLSETEKTNFLKMRSQGYELGEIWNNRFRQDPNQGASEFSTCVAISANNLQKIYDANRSILYDEEQYAMEESKIEGQKSELKLALDDEKKQINSYVYGKKGDQQLFENLMLLRKKADLFERFLFSKDGSLLTRALECELYKCIPLVLEGSAQFNDLEIDNKVPVFYYLQKIALTKGDSFPFYFDMCLEIKDLLAGDELKDLYLKVISYFGSISKASNVKLLNEEDYATAKQIFMEIVSKYKKNLNLAQLKKLRLSSKALFCYFRNDADFQDYLKGLLIYEFQSVKNSHNELEVVLDAMQYMSDDAIKEFFSELNLKKGDILEKLITSQMGKDFQEKKCSEYLCFKILQFCYALREGDLYNPYRILLNISKGKYGEIKRIANIVSELVPSLRIMEILKNIEYKLLKQVEQALNLIKCSKDFGEEIWNTAHQFSALQNVEDKEFLEILFTSVICNDELLLQDRLQYFMKLLAEKQKKLQKQIANKILDKFIQGQLGRQVSAEEFFGVITTFPDVYNKDEVLEQLEKVEEQSYFIRLADLIAGSTDFQDKLLQSKNIKYAIFAYRLNAIIVNKLLNEDQKKYKNIQQFFKRQANFLNEFLELLLRLIGENQNIQSIPNLIKDFTTCLRCAQRVGIADLKDFFVLINKELKNINKELKNVPNLKDERKRINQFNEVRNLVNNFVQEKPAKSFARQIFETNTQSFNNNTYNADKIQMQLGRVDNRNNFIQLAGLILNNFVKEKLAKSSAGEFFDVITQFPNIYDADKILIQLSMVNDQSYFIQLAELISDSADFQDKLLQNDSGKFKNIEHAIFACRLNTIIVTKISEFENQEESSEIIQNFYEYQTQFVIKFFLPLLLKNLIPSYKDENFELIFDLNQNLAICLRYARNLKSENLNNFFESKDVKFYSGLDCENVDLSKFANWERRAQYYREYFVIQQKSPQEKYEYEMTESRIKVKEDANNEMSIRQLIINIEDNLLLALFKMTISKMLYFTILSNLIYNQEGNIEIEFFNKLTSYFDIKKIMLKEWGKEWEIDSKIEIFERRGGYGIIYYFINRHLKRTELFSEQLVINDKMMLLYLRKLNTRLISYEVGNNKLSSQAHAVILSHVIRLTNPEVNSTYLQTCASVFGYGNFVPLKNLLEKRQIKKAYKTIWKDPEILTNFFKQLKVCKFFDERYSFEMFLEIPKLLDKNSSLSFSHKVIEYFYNKYINTDNNIILFYILQKLFENGQILAYGYIEKMHEVTCLSMISNYMRSNSAQQLVQSNPNQGLVNKLLQKCDSIEPLCEFIRFFHSAIILENQGDILENQDYKINLSEKLQQLQQLQQNTSLIKSISDVRKLLACKCQQITITSIFNVLPKLKNSLLKKLSSIEQIPELLKICQQKITLQDIFNQCPNLFKDVDTLQKFSEMQLPEGHKLDIPSLLKGNNVILKELFKKCTNIRLLCEFIRFFHFAIILENQSNILENQDYKINLSEKLQQLQQNPLLGKNISDIQRLLACKCKQITITSIFNALPNLKKSLLKKIFNIEQIPELLRTCQQKITLQDIFDQDPNLFKDVDSLQRFSEMQLPKGHKLDIPLLLKENEDDVLIPLIESCSTLKKLSTLLTLAGDTIQFRHVIYLCYSNKLELNKISDFYLQRAKPKSAPEHDKLIAAKFMLFDKNLLYNFENVVVYAEAIKCYPNFLTEISVLATKEFKCFLINQCRIKKGKDGIKLDELKIEWLIEILGESLNYGDFATLTKIEKRQIENIYRQREENLEKNEEGSAYDKYMLGNFMVNNASNYGEYGRFFNSGGKKQREGEGKRLIEEYENFPKTQESSNEIEEKDKPEQGQ